jgi:hypothetical protein
MNALTTRILKEARPLLWPWCAAALASALPLVYRLGRTQVIWVFGLLVVPLLAAIPLGNEFQHRTFSLLLSQPIGRMKIWCEKLSVTVVAVVSAVLVFSLALRATSFRPDGKDWVFAAAWILASVASATFWTLIARSTVGGFVLTMGVQCFVMNLAYWLHRAGLFSPTGAFVPTATLVLLGYAGVVLWVGGRALVRFETTGGVAGDDLLVSGPDLMPGVFGSWLRCRPTGAVLNLFRKEFRLLRPVWLISLLAALGWACLTLYGMTHKRGLTGSFQTAVVITLVISTLMITILAGSLSLGEERTSGTHAWNLTLPAAARLQWGIKLFTALFAGFVGAGVLPLLIAGRLFRTSHLDVGTSWLLGVALLSLASFWCACAANGTVRAVLSVLPVVIALGTASELGGQAGEKLMNLFVSRFDPFANFRFTTAVVTMFETSATLRFVIALGFDRGFATPALTFSLAPAYLLAVIQSYRQFRSQVQANTLSLVRTLLPLAVVAFLCSFSLMAFSDFVSNAFTLRNTALFEAVQAIGKIDRGGLDATHPLQLTVDDLAKVSPLSEPTRRLLRSSRVTIVPIESLPHSNWFSGNSTRGPIDLDTAQSRYVATLYLAGGSECTQAFQQWIRNMRTLIVVCE